MDFINVHTHREETGCVCFFFVIEYIVFITATGDSQTRQTSLELSRAVMPPCRNRVEIKISKVQNKNGG